MTALDPAKLSQRPPRQARKDRGRPRPVGHRPRGTLAQAYDAHGSALFSLARVIVGEPTQAEAIVVHVLLDAETRSISGGGTPVRRHLARRVYLRCTRARLGVSSTSGDLPSGDYRPTTDPQTSIVATLSALSEQQRAVIALCLYGDHTYRQVADVMALPASVVADLIRSGLQRLRSADGRAD